MADKRDFYEVLGIQKGASEGMKELLEILPK
jgi:DnaJ-class molecular chaperone